MKKFYLILVLLFSYFVDYGQRANYSDFISRNSPDFSFKIAGKVGNTFHVWKIPSSSKESSLILFIFSDQMKLIYEKNITLKKTKFSNVELAFQMNVNDYYVTINYLNHDKIPKRQLLKVNEKGEFTDSSFLPEKIVEPDSVNFNNGVGSETKDSASAFFDHPIITLDNDSAIWAGYKKKNDKDSSLQYSLFLVKPDSNLKVTANGIKFIGTGKQDIFKDYKYSIPKIFIAEGNFVLISNCIHRYYQTLAPAYFPASNEPFLNHYTPSRQVEAEEISSLRIIQLDKLLNILKDTSIEANSPYSKSDLLHSYYYTLANTINVLCLQQFSGNLNGIRHIVIGKNFIRGTDLQVNPHYNYLLSNLNIIDDITFLIPYTYHGKTGFMKFTNKPQSE